MGLQESSVQSNVSSIHDQLMQFACGAHYNTTVTSSTLSYEQFLASIAKINKICSEYKDEEGRVLRFAVKKGSDTSIFWRATVRIACVKFNSITSGIESHRFLSLRQFLQVFSRISYECTKGSSASMEKTKRNITNYDVHNAEVEHECSIVPTMAASFVFAEEFSPLERCEGAMGGAVGDGMSESPLEECIICFERIPEISLPCAHAFCVPCIEQWWEYCKDRDTDCNDARLCDQKDALAKTCPVCRESVENTEDAWVLSQTPDDTMVCRDIQMSLMSLARSE